MPNDPDPPPAPDRKTHGHTGPTTPSEDRTRHYEGPSKEDKARIAEEASRAEDA